MGSMCCFNRRDNDDREWLIKKESIDDDSGSRGRKSSSCILSDAAQDEVRRSVTLNPEKEIVESEKRYFNVLRTLHNEFLVPLFNTDILPPEKQRLFTHDINMIYNFHRTFLEDLKNTDDIPRLFIQRADFFKIYVHYVENYTLILDSLKEFRRDNPKFLKFTKKLMERKLYIESLLISPIQRIPRYELLLKEMLKSSGPGEPDYDKLIRAKGKVHEVAEKLNERQREFEKLSKLSCIASRIHGRKNVRQLLYSSQRKFLDEQEMQRQSKYNDSKLQPCYTLLFSDQIITTDLSYKFKRLVKLAAITKVLVVREFKGLLCKVENERDFQLYCKELEMVEEWQEKILTARDRVFRRAESRISLMSPMQRLSARKALSLTDEEIGESSADYLTMYAKRQQRNGWNELAFTPTSSGSFSARPSKVQPLKGANQSHTLVKYTRASENPEQDYDDYGI